MSTPTLSSSLVPGFTCRFATACIVAILLGPASAAARERLELDAAHSTVAFSVPIAGGLTSVQGRFDRFRGTLDYDLDSPERSLFELEIEAASISTGHQGRDEHLRQPDFFAVEDHPTLLFRTESIRPMADRPHAWRVAGQIRIRGVSRPIELTVERQHAEPLVWLGRRPSAVFEARGTLDREAFGIEAPGRWREVVEATGEVAMGREIELELHFIAEVPDLIEALAEGAETSTVTKALSRLSQLEEASAGPTPWEWALNGLGYRLLAERPEAAVAVFAEATRRVPDSPNAWDSLGEGLLRAGREADAIDAWKRVLELRPDDERARLILAELTGGKASPSVEPALGTPLRFPIGLAVDGEIAYVSERAAARIRRIDLRTGTSTIYAGTTGVQGFHGDGGPATRAWLFAPNDLLLAPDGDLVVSDTFNHRIRRVDAETGTIRTIVGTGTAGYRGDGGPALEARIRGPYGLDWDLDGSLIFADTDNHRIRRVDLQTGRIETLAGTGQPGDEGDGGPAREARLRRPHSVRVLPDGDLILGDSFNHRIRRLDRDSGRIAPLAGTGDLGKSPIGTSIREASFAYFGCLALAPGERLVVAEWVNDRVVSFPLGAQDASLALVAEAVDAPAGCAFGPRGRLLQVSAEGEDGAGRLLQIGPEGGVEVVAGP